MPVALRILHQFLTRFSPQTDSMYLAKSNSKADELSSQAASRNSSLFRDTSQQQQLVIRVPGRTKIKINFYQVAVAENTLASACDWWLSAWLQLSC
jgi:hypothetical protein